MDWLHCNRCFRRKGQNFALSNCGHICCERCLNPKQCIVCGASCNYLPITDKMQPREQVFFKDPVKLMQSRLEHIAQIALFQQKQKERVTAYFRHRSVETERRLKDITEQCGRQISELKRQNSELKKPLSQRRLSPGLAVASPVIPRSRTMSPAESQERDRFPRHSLTVTPGSATSISSSLHGRRYMTPLSRNMSFQSPAESQERARVPRLSLTIPQTPPGSATSTSSSLYELGPRTPASLITPTRTLRLPPDNFQFQRRDRHYGHQGL